MENGAAAVENNMSALQKLNIELPCDPAIPVLGIHPKELKAGSRRDICTRVHGIIHLAKRGSNTRVHQWMPVTKGQILYESTYMRSQAVRFTETESRMVLAGGGGRGYWGVGV